MLKSSPDSGKLDTTTNSTTGPGNCSTHTIPDTFSAKLTVSPAFPDMGAFGKQTAPALTSVAPQEVMFDKCWIVGFRRTFLARTRRPVYHLLTRTTRPVYHLLFSDECLHSPRFGESSRGCLAGEEMLPRQSIRTQTVQDVVASAVLFVAIG